MKFEDAQLYIRFENQINRKTYAEIANEIGIGTATVGDIVRGTYKKLKPKTNSKLEEWKQEKVRQCQKICRKKKLVVPRMQTLSFCQHVLKFFGVGR